MERALTVAITKNDSKLEDELDSCTDDTICEYKTAINGGYIKQEPYDTEEVFGNIKNCGAIKDEIIEDLRVAVQETQLLTNIKENNLTCCEGCGEEYDLYCLKCPMLIRILNNTNSDLSDNSIEGTLPKNFVDMCETQFGVGIVALRVIPKGVVFGPFDGLDVTEDGAVSNLILGNKELAYARDFKWLNWMQYIQRVDQNSHSNLTPFQYEDELYYRSDCHIGVGDELLVCRDNICEENGTQETSLKPKICDSLDDVYACTFCCVGYKSICHLAAHNFRCPQKKTQNGFCKEIIQCAFCKIYMDKKEYSDYHVDRCFRRNRKIFVVHQDDNNDKSFGCSQCSFQAKTTEQLKLHIVSHSVVTPFACSICSFKTTTSAKLKRHIVIHNDDKPFACSFCVYKTKTVSCLQQHMLIHSDDKAFACSLCSFKSKTRKRLRNHVLSHEDDKPCSESPFKTNISERLKQHSDDKPFACSLCSFKTVTSKRLKEHIATHYEDKPFGCSLCSFKTKTKSILNRHMSIHSDDRPFACSVCSYKTKTKSCLKQHTFVHSEYKPFACTLCSFKTTTSKRLKAHVATHNDDKPFVCSLCSYRSRTNSHLKTHLAIHKDDKPFACSHCSYKSKTKALLKLHNVMHNEDKPFACSLCSYKTKTNQGLKRHIASHTDDKPFACSLCSFKARTNSNLKSHIPIHQDDKPFACSLCAFKTKTNYQLKQHVAIHNGDKPYACTVCLYKARTNYKLKLHMAIHSDVSVSRINQEKSLIESKD